MFNSSVLDVALGLVVVFILLSTVCTAIREGLESVLKTRAAYLERGIRELLNDREGAGTARAFFEHPIINGLFQDAYVQRGRAWMPWLFAYGGKMPSYIPARDFAVTVIDLAARGPDRDKPVASTQPITLDSLRRSVGKMQDPSLQRVLLSALDSAERDVRDVQRYLEAWFDGSMERVSGWYKRSTQAIIFGIAALVVCTLNVDAIALADSLYHDQAVRGAAVAAAAQLKPDGDDSQVALRLLNGLHLPIGWSAPPADHEAWLLKILGLLLTTFGATLGAPFWFDMLNKVTMIRGSLKPNDRPSMPMSDLPQTAAVASTQLLAAGSSELPALAPASLRASANDANPPETDSCALNSETITPDEALPPATGGTH